MDSIKWDLIKFNEPVPNKIIFNKIFKRYNYVWTIKKEKI